MNTFNFLLIVRVVLIIISIAVLTSFFALCRHVKEILIILRHKEGVRLHNGVLKPIDKDGAVARQE